MLGWTSGLRVSVHLFRTVAFTTLPAATKPTERKVYPGMGMVSLSRRFSGLSCHKCFGTSECLRHMLATKPTDVRIEPDVTSCGNASRDLPTTFTVLFRLRLVGATSSDMWAANSQERTDVLTSSIADKSQTYRH